jgi:hypothetical protein
MEDACKQLWAAVLKQAIKDAQRELSANMFNFKKMSRQSAVRWFLSETQEVGSFLWVCSLTRIEPESVLTLLTKKVKGARSSKYVYSLRGISGRESLSKYAGLV